jgi:hypothetical protein
MVQIARRASRRRNAHKSAPRTMAFGSRSVELTERAGQHFRDTVAPLILQQVYLHA